MALPYKITVSGTLTPSGAIGIYTKGIDVYGQPAWYKDGGTYLISSDGESAWLISASGVGYWQLVGASYIGDYIAITGVTGTATVNEYVPQLISLTDNGSGSVTAAVTGDGTITLYYRIAGTSTWTTGNNRSGSGNITQTGLTVGKTYEFYVSSVSDEIPSSPSNVRTIFLLRTRPETGVELADAVVTVLNANTFSQAFTAETVIVPVKDIKDLATLAVSVTPRNLEVTSSSRASAQYVYTIDIADQKKIDDVATIKTECNDLMELCLEIENYIRNYKFNSVGLNVSRVEIAPLFSSEHIMPPSVFTSLISVMFKGIV